MLHAKCRPLLCLGSRIHLHNAALLLTLLLSLTVLILYFSYVGDAAKSAAGKHKQSSVKSRVFPFHVQVLSVSENESALTTQRSQSMPEDTRIAVLVISATRTEAIISHLGQLKQLRPSVDNFPIIVSQDGSSEEVAEVIKRFTASEKNTFYVQHKEREAPPPGTEKGSRNYFYIAQHYKWALDTVFKKLQYKTVIITEDDLDLAKDFFSYFSALQHLLYEDPTIWCISAWNDNGAPGLADWSRQEQLYRTDFFPGLGWMLTSELWEELSAKWPKSYWDDWLRYQDIRKERACIRPEISRTLHNMSLAGKGSSGGLYKNYLSSIRLPEQSVDFSLVDVNRMKKENFDPKFGRLVQEAKPISIDELLLNSTNDGLSPQNSYRVVYRDPREYRRIASHFKLMNDIRSGMARTSYYGVVPFVHNGVHIYAVHGNLDVGQPLGSTPSSRIYDVNWDKMVKYLDFAAIYCRESKWTGKCDPNDAGMRAWFAKKHLMKRLNSWGEMTVF